MQTIAVYCGARPATPSIEAAAFDFGKLLARRGLRLVYGGSDAGLMKTLADSFLDAGGYAIGVSSVQLVGRTPINPRCQRKIVAANLPERKALMLAMADAAVGLPGALGTLDETFDAAARAKTESLRLRVGLLNVGGFYNPIVALRENARRAHLVNYFSHFRIRVERDANFLLDKLLLPFE